jgi:4-diphosphocytidyl-2-C-methyl-D-erythritol kinase
MTAPDMPDPAEHTGLPRSATATAQGMLILWLSVGDHRPDGGRDLVTVRQALDLTETVTVTVTGQSESPEITGVDLTGKQSRPVTAGDTGRAAVAAVTAVVDRYHRRAPQAVLPQIHVDIVREIPDIGDTGSADAEAADAAAALIATRELLHGAGAADAGYSLAPRPTDAELQDLAASLGRDVPAHLLGGTVMDTGAIPGAADLVPVMSRGTRHWAMALDPRPLPYREVLDRLDAQRDAAARGERPDVRAGDVTAVQRALLTDNPTELADLLANDLQSAALSLRPELRRTLTAAREAGALGTVVAGPGPTVTMLCSDREHAVEVATAVSVAGHTGPTFVAASSSHGARPA